MAGTKSSAKPKRSLPKIAASARSKVRAGSVSMNSRERWQRLGIYAAVGVMAASALVTWWHPPTLERALSPLWTMAGPAFILLTLWGTALYVMSRRDRQATLRHWRWWAAGLLGATVLVALPNAAGGVSLYQLPLDSDVGALAAGPSGILAWLRVIGIAVVGITLVFPNFVRIGLVSVGRNAGRGASTLAHLIWTMLQRARTAEARAEETITAAADTPNAEAPRIVLHHQTSRMEVDADFESEPEATDEDESDTMDAMVDTEEADGEEDPEEAPSESEPVISPPIRTVTVSERSPEEIVASRDPFAGLPSVQWNFPPLEIFSVEPAQEIDHDAHLKTAQAIESTLAEYGIEVTVAEVRPGPTVTLFGLRPGWTRRFKEIKERGPDGNQISRREEVGRVRVKVDRIAALDRDLALQLKAPSVRIEAPIPGTNLIGIEVPNPIPQTVYIHSQLGSEAFQRLKARTKLTVPLGKGSGGEPEVADLTKMPHLLVAGATGSGKSVFINSLITSLLWHATPRDVRFIMVDPKRVELTIYNGIPHLITPVVVDAYKAVNALRWLIMQMDERLEALSGVGVRDIASYNKKRGDAEKMPYLVLIVDELADLMMTAGKAFEQGLVRLAQMGRATGIHLVVATQRPSVDVVTGLIKANFPTRISFMVTSLVDSRTILDSAGAEKLLGRGDMLYLPQDLARPIRIQSAFVSEDESTSIVTFWKNQSGGFIPPELPDLVGPEEMGLRGIGNASGNDSLSTGVDGASPPPSSGPGEMMDRARELAELYNGKVSTSLLQRRLAIGYPRAARIRDKLVEEGLAMADIPNAPAETQGRGRRRARQDAE